MSGIAQDVTALERQLQSVTIERDRLAGDNAHLKTVVTIQEETIALLQSERDRYFKSASEIGMLCETLADGLINGVAKWKENEARRTQPQVNESRIVTAAAGQPKPTVVAPTLEQALSSLANAKGEAPRSSASLLPKVDPK